LKELGETMVLKGPKLVRFVKEQQNLERRERKVKARNRERK